MADPPAWGFTDLDPTTRWVSAHGLATTLTPPSVPLDDESWSRLRSQCSAHRLGGHLVAAVTEGSLPTTEVQRAQAAAIEANLTQQRIHYDDVCRPPLQALESADVPYRLLKGSALPWSDYPDPQLRPTGDLDLLVPGSRLSTAVGCLQALGATLVNPEPTDHFAEMVFKGLTVKMPSGLEVDLHRILNWGPLGVRVPEDDLWAPGRVFDRLGEQATTMDVERTLIHVCAHLLILGAMRASEVRDVAQLATSDALDPDRAIEIARRWRHEAVLAVGLRMAERELGLRKDAHPLADWAARFRPRARDLLWLRIDRPDAPVKGVEVLAVLLELPDLRARGELLRAVTRPLPGTDPSLGARIVNVAQSLGGRLRGKSESR